MSVAPESPLPDDVPYKEDFIEAGKTCPGISARLLAAQARIESVNFNRDVISGKRYSPAGAMGISQFMPATAKAYGIDPLNPQQAIAAQGKMMCALYVKYGHVNMALSGYNCGPSATERFGVPCPYKETQNYIRRINALLKGNS